MPEIVYPSPDKDGKARKWNKDVFPKNTPSPSDEWQAINSILEAVAMNNRYGRKTVDELRTDLTKRYIAYTRDDLAKTDQVEERDKKFAALGLILYYTNEVFDNLGGAYRESSIGL